MGNIITLLGLGCIAIGTVLNMFPTKKETPKAETKKETKPEPKDPGEAAAGL